jgi:DNA-dependent protein kinase catalytic subunit
VRIVERKLNGAHPSHLTLDDLRASEASNVRKELVDSESGWKAVEDIVLGAPAAERRVLPALGLSPEQQVRVLVEQATDPNILGRTWTGWMPYV